MAIPYTVTNAQAIRTAVKSAEEAYRKGEITRSELTTFRQADNAIREALRLGSKVIHLDPKVKEAAGI